MLLHRVLLLGEMKEQGPSNSVHGHSKGPPGALCTLRRLDPLIIAHLGVDISPPTSNIGGQGLGRCTLVLNVWSYTDFINLHTEGG